MATPPEWNAWKHFHEKDTANAIPGTYYVEGGPMEYISNEDPATYKSAPWFSTKKNVVATAEAGEEANAAEDQKEAKREKRKNMVLNKGDISRLTTLQLITHSRNHNLDNGDEAGSGTWFEVVICGSNGETKRLPNGQLLSWRSHSNWFKPNSNLPANDNDGNNEWCRGHIFTKDDEIFKHLKDGDIISVWMSVAPHHRNHARSGYLVFGFGDGPMTCKTPKIRSDQDPTPCISVYARERQECLMILADDGSTEVKANNVRGGLEIMPRLLETNDNDWIVRSHSLGPQGSGNGNNPPPPNFVSVTELVKGKKDTIPPLRVVRHSTIKNTGGDNAVENDQTPPKIAVWDDFEVNKANINVEAPNAKILIYQMHAPLWTGSLWQTLLQRSRTADGPNIVVIDADDLRASGIRISRGISWEKTMEDIKAKIKEITNPIPADVRNKVNLLVRCGYEGVLHARPSPSEERPFVFHMVPNMAEGDLLRPYQGYMSGIHLAFVSGLAASLARQPVKEDQPVGRTQIGLAIELAMIWSNRFATTGFRKDGDGRLNYPNAKDINHYRTPKIKITYGDHLKVRGDGQWSLFNVLEEPQESVAADVVKLGTDRLEASIPTAQFGKVQTADRTEIEGFRSTAAVIREYLNGKPKKPLSIAVFGQPGAGKSFGLKQVIMAVLERGKEWEPIEANVSQFLDYSDLVAVFRKVRDAALGGETPVVLFDEFDSSFNGKPLGWLKYFLAPMQDGVFLDSGSVRPLGPAIFVFIGGTSHTFKEFKNGKEVTVADEAAADKKAAERELEEAKANHEAADKEYERATADRAAAKKIVADKAKVKKEIAEKELKEAKANRKSAEEALAAKEAADKATGRDPVLEDKQAKKPDFVSRLSAHINVRGPNRSGTRDRMFILRRAMLLHSQLKKHFGVEVKEIQVDNAVLNALLNHKSFPNGTRSIELILQTSRLSGRRRFESSDLASDEQLSMHVGDDVKEFHALTNTPIALESIRPVDVDLANKLMWTKLPKDKN
ncbi:hypothetical protein CEP54_000233 [Fusarium duplospermum]|uniref:ATPase AAA-type core domain-containing protein n=1 Tax=Fusarium duplospermum TaxID=1325734 RepID=A0A428R8H7_9HYPO|nr:hypothetical protein CEP54_000233 [Fusarium duplospermum]